MKNPERCTWTQLVIFCNKHEIDEVVRRSQIMEAIHQDGKGTIDTYVRTLRDKKYLKWIKPGHYEILKKIPVLLMTDGVSTHESDMERLFQILEKAAGENNGEEFKMETSN